MIEANQIDFFVVGAMKCGTTSICEIIDQHPELFVCTPKEPDYFCRDTGSFDSYISLFSAANKNQLLGEGSTSYSKSFVFKGVPQKLYSHNSKAKIIYIVRDPIKRIESHWNHLAASGRTKYSFSEALIKMPHLIDTTLYHKQISAFLDFFPVAQVLIIFLEDFKNDPYNEVFRLFNFLGVQKLSVSGVETPKHVSSEKKIDSSLLKLLRKSRTLRNIAGYFPRYKKFILSGMRYRNNFEAKWTADDLEYVKNIIKPDSEKFLSFAKKHSSYWRSLCD